MNTHDATDKAHSQKLVIMSAGMLLVAVSIFGGLFYLQRQSAMSDLPTEPATKDEIMTARATRQGMVYDAATSSIRYADLSPEQQNAFVAKLKLIREKWRPWAKRNQSTLKKMLGAQANDEATLMSVYQALPSSAADRGISNADLIPMTDSKSHGALMKARLPMFSWNIVGKEVRIPERLRTRRAESQTSKMKVVKKDFAQLRDIRLSVSRSHGEPTFSLWASGRITKSQRVEQMGSEVRNGQIIKFSTFEAGPHKEIVPPFEFLQ